MSDITPFRIEVPQAELDDLAARLANTRFPEKETPDDWSQGVPLAYARALVQYWRDDYDWRAREAYFNRHPAFLLFPCLTVTQNSPPQ